jgi:uncharacterized repeat protein (TIGR01451 family)
VGIRLLRFSFFLLLAPVLLAGVGFTTSPGQAQEPSLALVKVARPAPVAPGEQLTYTLIVTNTGQVAMSDFAVRDRVPEGTSFVSAAYLDGRWMYSGPAVGGKGEVVWAAESPLPPGEAYRLLMIVAVDSGTTDFVINDDYAVLAVPEGSLLVEGPPLRTEVRKPTPTATTGPSPTAAIATPTAQATATTGATPAPWCPLVGGLLVFSGTVRWIGRRN